MVTIDDAYSNLGSPLVLDPDRQTTFPYTNTHENPEEGDMQDYTTSLLSLSISLLLYVRKKVHTAVYQQCQTCSRMCIFCAVLLSSAE